MTDIHYKNRIVDYFNHSKLGYNFVLNGSQHVGFHPLNERISEKKAHILFHEKVAEKLQLTSNDLVFDAGSGQGVVSVYLAKNYKCRIEGVALAQYEKVNSFKNAKKIWCRAFGKLSNNGL